MITQIQQGQHGEGNITRLTDTKDRKSTGRKDTRYETPLAAEWDFFTVGTGSKSGQIKNISKGGCLLCTSEMIDHRRWIRLIIKEQNSNLWIAAVGRVIRRENEIDMFGPDDITLYRFGVEFIQPLNPLVLDRIKSVQQTCCVCSSKAGSIQDPNDPEKVYCVLCHLRIACHNLLSDEKEERPIA